MFTLISKIFDVKHHVRIITEMVCRLICITLKETQSVFVKLSDLFNTNVNLGLYHMYNGNLSDAKFRFWLINLVKKNNESVLYNIGRCLVATNNHVKAQKIFEQVLTINSNHEETIYELNKIKQPKNIQYVPISAIKQHFNFTAHNFIQYWLVAKEYHGHEYVCYAVKNFTNTNLDDLDVLDLGCGSGICGQMLKHSNMAKRIIGVDISEKMLAVTKCCKAHDVRVYDEVYLDDILGFLEKNNFDKQLFDVVILSEVLHYDCRIRTFLEAASKALKKGGIMVCVTRYGRGQDYSFSPQSDSFKYSIEYLNDCATQAKLSVLCSKYCRLYGSQVEGVLFVCST